MGSSSRRGDRAWSAATRSPKSRACLQIIAGRFELSSVYVGIVHHLLPPADQKAEFVEQKVLEGVPCRHRLHIQLRIRGGQLERGAKSGA
eukprot:9495503-Pyramimonas_sp.AAC.1